MEDNRQARTTSLAFPNMFDVTTNRVNVLKNKNSIVNRCKLLMLTEPTELYNSPNFGVGMRQHMFKQNSDNTAAIIRDEIVAQLRLYEPFVDPDKTTFADGLIYSGSQDIQGFSDGNHHKFSVGLSTVFNESIDIDLSDLSEYGDKLASHSM